MANIVNRVIDKGRRLKNDLLFNTYAPAGSLQNISDTIIMYHGVDSRGNTTYNTRHASIACFKSHLTFLKKHFEILSLQDFFIRGPGSKKPRVTLTFDDGYRNNYTNAFPLLEEMQIPATFFITGMNEIKDRILWADFINIVSVTSRKTNVIFDGEEFEKKGNAFISKRRNLSLVHVIKNEKPQYRYKKMLFDIFMEEASFMQNETLSEWWQLMTDEEVKEVGLSKYVKIGSHGYFHNNLGNLALAEAVKELADSKQYLEKLVPYKINAVAYPDGSFTKELAQKAFEMGFSLQLAASEGKDDIASLGLNYLIDRKGIYTCDTCANQLFSVLGK